LTIEILITLIVGAFISGLVGFGIKRMDRMFVEQADLKTDLATLRVALLGANGTPGIAGDVRRLREDVDDHEGRLIGLEHARGSV